MDAAETIVDRIEARGHKWFGHLLRMPDERCQRKYLSKIP